MARLGEALAAKGIIAPTALISGYEKQELADKGTPFEIIDALLESAAKYGAAWCVKVLLDGRKREIYFGTGEHIDATMEAIAEMCKKEPVGPVVLYAYRNRAGQTGYGLAEVETTSDFDELAF